MAHTISSMDSSSSATDHLAIDKPGNTMNEKILRHDGRPVDTEDKGLRFAGRKTVPEDDEEEDMDALIEELESLDPDAEIEEINEFGQARQVPEELLQTDTRMGLAEPEVIARRKKYGLNQMKEEKENLILKFLGYFVGPIQFVMEVSSAVHSRRAHND
jgi:magnesium-transporting ATPase (P-type)